MMAQKKRWKEIDYLRGMAILMVLLYHSVIVYPVNLHEIPWCRLLHSFLWVVQMPLFFLVSGFCFSCREGYGAYLKKKVMRILVPHIVFSALDIVPRIIPNPLVNEQMNAAEALTDFVLYGGSDWFLWTLFLISALFPVLDKLMEKGRYGRAAVAAGAVLLYIMKPEITDIFLLNMVSQYLVYYLIGYFLRRKADVMEMRRWAAGGVTAAALICSAAAFYGYTAFGEQRFLEFLCAMSAVVFCYGLAVRCQGLAARFLQQCGQYSLQMYLLDAYALVATRTVLVAALHIQEPVPVILGNFLADTALVLFASRYILTKVKGFRVVSGIPEKDGYAL